MLFTNHFDKLNFFIHLTFFETVFRYHIILDKKFDFFTSILFPIPKIQV